MYSSKGYYLKQSFSNVGGILGGAEHVITSLTEADLFIPLFDIPVFDNWSLKNILHFNSSLRMVLPQFTNAGYVIECGSGQGFCPQLAVIADRKAMCLVTDLLNQ